MEEKTREMSLTSSHGQMQIREEMEALRQAREKLKTECNLLQAKADGLSVNEQRRWQFELHSPCSLWKNLRSESIYIANSGQFASSYFQLITIVANNLAVPLLIIYILLLK